MFRSTGDRAGLALGIIAIAAGVSVFWAIPAAAGPADGGQNTRIHKLPGRLKTTVKCRICARARCTVVTVRGRCTKKAALAALKQRLKQRSRQQRALNPPVLDDRRYEDLRAEMLRRTPRHTPEWTDHNDSDPGMAILEVARRNSALIRVQPVPGSTPALPEKDDEVLTTFEHGDGK